MPDTKKGSSWKCTVCGLRTHTKCTCGAPVCKAQVKMGSQTVWKDCLGKHQLQCITADDWGRLRDIYGGGEASGELGSDDDEMA